MFVRARTKHCNAVALGLLRCTSVFIIKSQVYLLCCLDLDSGSCRVKFIYFLFGPRFTVMQGQGNACVNPGLLCDLELLGLIGAQNFLTLFIWKMEIIIGLMLLCLVSTIRSHILKQTCMYYVLVDSGH